jgi:predicted nucleic acid-binding protein
LDFVDALVVAHMRHGHISTVVSFDRDFDRVPGIQRRDP